MTRPRLDPTWATATNYTAGPDVGTATKVVPGSGLRAQGWDPDDRPGAQHLNAMFNAHGAWANYLKDIDWLNWTPIRPALSTPGGVVSLGVAANQTLPLSGPLMVAMTADGSFAYVCRTFDGITWEQNIITGFYPNVDNPRTIIYSPTAGLWIAISKVGTTHQIVTSPDGGVTWTPRTDPETDADRTAVVDNGSLIVMLRSGVDKFLTSVNGTTWVGHAHPNPTSDYRALAFGGSKWIACGHGGTTLYSADGVTWTIGGNTGLDTNDLAYDSVHGVFIAVGGNAPGGAAYVGIATSPDGVTWTDRSILSPIGVGVVSAYYSGSVGVLFSVTVDASGAAYARGQNCVLRSTDGGVTWEAQPLLFQTSGTAVIALAMGRLIIASADPDDATQMAVLLGVRTTVQ